MDLVPEYLSAWDELLGLSIQEAASRIGSGELSPRDLVAASLRRFVCQ